MKWTDKELDAHFKTHSPEIPAYDASFWKEVEPLLPKKPSNRKAIILFFSAFGIITAISAMYLLQNDTASITKETAIATHTSVEIPSASSKNIPSINQISKEENTVTAVSNTIEKTTTTKKINPTNSIVQSEIIQKNDLVPSESPSKLEKKQSKTIRLKNIELKANTLSFSSDTAEIKALPTPENSAATIAPTHTISDINNDSTTTVTSENTLSNPIEQLKSTTDSSIKSKVTHVYAQFVFGLGQSAMKSTPGKSGSLQSYALGGGLTHQIGKLQLGLGGQFRMDVAQNIRLQHQIFQGTSVTNYQRIFSFDIPLSIGIHSGKWGLDALITPGIQAFFSGKYEEYTSNILTREEVQTKTIRDAKSTTMEVGMRVQRDLTKQWQLGFGVSTDVIRPFNSPVYFGTTRTLPVHIQLGLRRNF